MLQFISRPRVLAGIYLLSIHVPFAACEHPPNRGGKDGDEKTTNWSDKIPIPDQFDGDYTQKASLVIREAFNTGYPGQVGYGFLLGYSSGYFVKRASKIVAFTLGGIFVLIQTLSYFEYIAVNHEKMEQEVNKALDQNADGKIDGDDFLILLNKVNA